LNGRLFSESTRINCPNENDLWRVELAEDFSKVLRAENPNERIFAFRSLIPLPPFLAKTFMDSGISVPSELGFLAVASGKVFLEENHH